MTEYCELCQGELDESTRRVRAGMDVCEVCAEFMAEMDPEDAEFWDG